MKVTREVTLPTEVILNIVLEPDDIEPHLDWAYRRLVNKVRIPGFRMGKAPRAILESVVGREHLLHEALERVVSGSVDEAVKQESLEPYIQPDVDVTSLEPLSIKATVPLEPLVTLGDYQSLRIDREPVSVGDEQVDDVLERLRSESAPWEPVDRPVQFDDQVTIDALGTVDGRTVVDDKGIEYVPSMENKLPLPGFSVYLEGAKKGESKTFTLTLAEDYSDSTLAGKECRFEVNIHEIKQKLLPELDDEFAKGVGEGFDSLQALKESVLENLTKTAEREADQELYEKAMQQVIDDATVEFPRMLVDRELEHMWLDREKALQSRRINMETYLQQVGKSEEELKEEMRPGTQERLVRSLALKKLAEDQNIEVTSEEVDKEIEGILSSSNTTDESVRQAVSSESFRNQIESTLLTRRTLERLAQIVQGDGAARKDSAGEEATEESTEEPNKGGGDSDS